MDGRFTVVLLCLLSMIPRNGNSHPLQEMESRLQEEQDEGFINRDMTSSLTGDESLGLKHQNNPNLIIRQKKSLDPDLKRAPQMVGTRRNFMNGQRLKQEEPHDSDRVDADYKENYFMRSEKGEPVFEEFEGDADNNFQYNENRNNKGLNGGYYKYRGNDRLRTSPLRSPIKYHKGDNSYLEGEEIMGNKGSLCNNNKHKYAPDITLGVMEVLKLEGGNKKKNFENGEESASFGRNEENIEGNRFRMNNELTRPNFKNLKPRKRNFGIRGDSIHTKLKGIDQTPVEGEYYYETEEKFPVMKEGEDNFEIEEYYDQLNYHDALHKREDNKHQSSESKNVEPRLNGDDASLKEEDKSKSVAVDKSDSVKDNAGNPDALKQQSDDSILQTADLVWKMNNNLQAKELNDVMKDSQRALEEVQLFQQKLALKSNNNPSADVKFQDLAPASSENKEIDKAKENRAKREDEDEQKNMKTGTDEGGGGEYEDEEGKGHTDEEEYYEEIDQEHDEGKDKSLKRAATKGEDVDNESDALAAGEDEDEDDELTLRNAPVENVEDQKKVKFEGKKDEKKDVRKGPKIWDQWGKWSPCSVTCGVGRSVRWRHCIGGGCAQGEKEAQIKKCTNPAC